MGKKDLLIILTIFIFCTCVFTIWKLIQIPEIERNVQDFIFSNRFYAKKIKIEKYFMTPEEVELLFRHNTCINNHNRLPQKFDKPNASIYLVIRLTNIGDRKSWGTLKCFTSKCEECEIHTEMLSVNKCITYVFPTCYTTSNPPTSEPIIKWKKLYTYG